MGKSGSVKCSTESFVSWNNGACYYYRVDCLHSRAGETHNTSTASTALKPSGTDGETHNTQSIVINVQSL